MAQFWNKEKKRMDYFSKKAINKHKRQAHQPWPPSLEGQVLELADGRAYQVRRDG